MKFPIRKDKIVTSSSQGVKPATPEMISKIAGQDVVDKDLPSKTEMAKNVAVASVKAIVSGMKTVSDDMQEKRLTICKTCEFYRHVDGRCAKCGCWTAFKARLEAWHCPIDKW